MTDDLVKRLRQYQVSAPPEHPVHPSICEEAADRIEQLESWERRGKAHAEERLALIQENKHLQERIKELEAAVARGAGLHHERRD